MARDESSGSMELYTLQSSNKQLDGVTVYKSK